MAERTHVTLQDVARAAAVSPATASRVLNGSAKVRDDLRARVEDAAGRLAYAPNAHAQALAGSPRRTGGGGFPDASGPSLPVISRGIMRVAGDNGLLVMLASTFR